MISKNQKKVPSTMPDASTALSCSFIEEVTEGDKTLISNENINTVNSSVNHDTPNQTGPKGVIQSCPDHPTRKMRRKNKKNPRQNLRLLNDAPNISAKKDATTTAAGTIKLFIGYFISLLFF